MKNPSTKNQKGAILRLIAVSLSVWILFVAIVPNIVASAMPIQEFIPVVWGDANYDGVTDSSDASKVLETYSKNSTGQSNSYEVREDATLDGVVDSSDASAILEQYARVSIGGYQKYIDTIGVYLIIPIGRTLTGIAKEENITYQELISLNPQIEDPEKLVANRDKVYVIKRKPIVEETTTTTIPTITTTTKATTITATTTKATTSKPVTKVCLYNEPDEKGWKVRSTQDTSRTDNILDYLKNEEYYLLRSQGGWEYIKTLRGIEGWIFIAGYNELFVDPATTTTTSKPSTTGTVTSAVVPLNGTMPVSVLNIIDSVKSQFPGCQISASVADITGKRVFSYNGNAQLFAGCSFKASFCTYVFETCEQQRINIDATKLEYRDGMKNTGCGTLQHQPYGTWWTIDYLETICTQNSDNTSYNVLRQRFPMAGYKSWLNRVGGQQIIWEPDVLYGSASSRERINEWVAIYRYITSGTDYANRLYYDLSVAYPRFYEDYTGPHKSGSCDDPTYTCASDCGVVYDWNGDPYIIAVIVQDAQNEYWSSQVVKQVANSIIYWVNSNNIF